MSTIAATSDEPTAFDGIPNDGLDMMLPISQPVQAIKTEFVPPAHDPEENLTPGYVELTNTTHNSLSIVANDYQFLTDAPTELEPPTQPVDDISQSTDSQDDHESSTSSDFQLNISADDRPEAADDLQHLTNDTEVQQQPSDTVADSCEQPTTEPTNASGEQLTPVENHQQPETQSNNAEQPKSDSPSHRTVRIPPHLMGRDLNNPAQDMVGTNRRVQRPRLGVKVPYRNLTSQIVTQDEIAQELLERQMRKYSYSDVPEGGDMFFAMKITHRLANKITSSENLEKKSLEAAKTVATTVANVTASDSSPKADAQVSAETSSTPAVDDSNTNSLAETSNTDVQAETMTTDVPVETSNTEESSANAVKPVASTPAASTPATSIPAEPAAATTTCVQAASAKAPQLDVNEDSAVVDELYAEISSTLKEEYDPTATPVQLFSAAQLQAHQSSGTSTPSNVVNGSMTIHGETELDNDTLLAILEGTTDVNEPSTAPNVTPPPPQTAIIALPTPDEDGKRKRKKRMKPILDPLLEKELALKQLMAFETKRKERKAKSVPVPKPKVETPPNPQNGVVVPVPSPNLVVLTPAPTSIPKAPPAESPKKTKRAPNSYTVSSQAPKRFPKKYQRIIKQQLRSSKKLKTKNQSPDQQSQPQKKLPEVPEVQIAIDRYIKTYASKRKHKPDNQNSEKLVIKKMRTSAGAHNATPAVGAKAAAASGNVVAGTTKAVVAGEKMVVASAKPVAVGEKPAIASTKAIAAGEKAASTKIVAAGQKVATKIVAAGEKAAAKTVAAGEKAAAKIVAAAEKAAAASPKTVTAAAKAAASEKSAASVKAAAVIDSVVAASAALADPAQPSVESMDVDEPIAPPTENQVPQDEEAAAELAEKEQEEAIAKSKTNTKMMREINRLLGDEGAINMIYSVEQKRQPGNKRDANAVLPSTRRKKKDLQLRTKLVKDAVLRLSMSDSSQGTPTRTVRRTSPETTPDAPVPAKSVSNVAAALRKASMESVESSSSELNNNNSGSAVSTPSRVTKARVIAAEASRIIRRHSSSSAYSSDEEETPRKGSGVSDKATTSSLPAVAAEKVTPDAAAGEKVEASGSECVPKNASVKTAAAEKKGAAKSSEHLKAKSPASSRRASKEPVSVEPEESRVQPDAALNGSLGTDSFEHQLSLKEITVRKYDNLVQIILISSSTKMKNALNIDILRELISVLRELEKDDSCRTVLVTSTGSSFCQGIDLQTLICADRTERTKIVNEFVNTLVSFTKCLSQFRKILIAGVHGSAVGLGVTMLPFFDMVYASDKATFYTPYVKLGQIPEAGATLTLPHLLGNAVTSELLFGCRMLTASEALQFGLVTRILWPDKFTEELLPLARGVAGHSLKAMEATKLLLRQCMTAKLEEQLETEATLLREHWCSDECQSSFKDYLEQEALLQNK